MLNPLIDQGKTLFLSQAPNSLPTTDDVVLVRKRQLTA